MERSVFLYDDDDGQIVFYFVFELFKTNQYTEFSKGLDRFIEDGVNIHGVGLLPSILYLFSRGGSKKVSEEILKMFQIALFGLFLHICTESDINF